MRRPAIALLLSVGAGASATKLQRLIELEDPSPLDLARDAVRRGDDDGDGMLDEQEFDQQLRASAVFRGAVFNALDRNGKLGSFPELERTEFVDAELWETGSPKEAADHEYNNIEEGSLWKQVVTDLGAGLFGLTIASAKFKSQLSSNTNVEDLLEMDSALSKWSKKAPNKIDTVNVPDFRDIHDGGIRKSGIYTIELKKKGKLAGTLVIKLASAKSVKLDPPSPAKRGDTMPEEHAERGGADFFLGWWEDTIVPFTDMKPKTGLSEGMLEADTSQELLGKILDAKPSANVKVVTGVKRWNNFNAYKGDRDGGIALRPDEDYPSVVKRSTTNTLKCGFYKIQVDNVKDDEEDAMKSTMEALKRDGKLKNEPKTVLISATLNGVDLHTIGEDGKYNC